MPTPAKNTICLWYDGTAEEAADFYVKTFPVRHRRKDNRELPCRPCRPDAHVGHVLGHMQLMQGVQVHRLVRRSPVELWRSSTSAIWASIVAVVARSCLTLAARSRSNA